MIEVRNLSRYYGAHRAVHDVSFTIESNQVVGFLGLNGAGKSTTLRVLAGLLAPSAGSVVIDGVDLSEAAVSFRRRIGFLPESPPLYTDMTVSEFLTYVGGLRSMSRSEIDARLPEVIDRCQLAGQADRVIDELSHGFQKRVGIAQAIIHQPRLVILDEPTSGLDPVQIVEMRQVIRSLKSEATVLVSSHILSEIEQTCDRVLVLNKGRLVAADTPHALAARFNTGCSLGLTLNCTVPQAEAALASLENLKSYEILREHDGRVEVKVEMERDAREALVAALVAAGLGIRRVEDAKDELEEVFMDLTKDGAA